MRRALVVPFVIVVVASLGFAACSDDDTTDGAAPATPAPAVSTAAPPETSGPVEPTPPSVPMTKATTSGPWEVFEPASGDAGFGNFEIGGDDALWAGEQVPGDDGQAQVRLWRFDGGRAWEATPPVDCETFVPVLTAAPDTVWVACTQGVAQFERALGEPFTGEWTTVPPPEPDAILQAIDLNGYEVAWMVSPTLNGGLVLRRLVGDQWDEQDVPRYVTLRDGGPTVGALPDGSVWIGTTTGLAHLDNGSWVAHDVAGAPDVTIAAQARGHDGSVWSLVSRSPDSLEWQRWLDGAWSTFPVDVAALKLDDACLADVDVAATEFDDPAERVAAATQALVGAAVAPDGALWTATRCVGVGRLDPVTGEAVTYTTEDGLPGLVFSTLGVASDGTVWVESGGSLAKLPPSRPE